MADTTKLNEGLAALTAQVAATETVEASAVALINGFAVAVTDAVTKALEADNKADQTSIDAATAAIEQARAAFAASGGTLGKAITDNTPAPPPAG